MPEQPLVGSGVEGAELLVGHALPPGLEAGVQETCRSGPAGSLTARIASAYDEVRAVWMLQHSVSHSTEEPVSYIIRTASPPH